MDSEVYGIKRSHIIISVAVMVTVIIAEIVSCLCMTSVKPAEGLVVDYEAAKDSMTELETELRVTDRAKVENADYAPHKQSKKYQLGDFFLCFKY